MDVSADMEVELNSAVTIVDAAKCKMYMKNFGEFFNNQIENAGTIVLSRTDITDAAKVQKDVDMLREKNRDAVIITTPLAELSGAQLLEIIEKHDTMLDDLLAEVRESRQHHDGECHEHHHHEGEECHGHHHDGEECHEHHHDGKECHEHHHDGECHEHHHEEEGCHGHHHHDGEECHEHHHDGEECHDHHHHGGEECHEHHHDGEEGHDHHHGHGCCGHDHDHHHADEVFTSWGMETIVPVTHDQLEDILKRLAHTEEFGQVLRAKGMLPTENPGEWLYFDLVPEQYEIREGRPDYTGKVCVIGASLEEEALNSVFGRS